MERMTAMDAQFLYIEDTVPASHSHTVKLLIYAPGPDGYSFEGSKEALRSRIHRLPPFRRRVVAVPFGLHHPMWIEDPDFDLDWHVRRMGCPAPGGPKELCELVSDILSRSLDRRRPLWELYLVEGLEDGKVAAVAKVHHAIADGISSAELLDLYHDPEQNQEVEAETPPWQPDPVPSRIALIVRAIVDVFRTLATALPQLLKAAKAVKERRSVSGLAESQIPPKPFKAPTLAFNRVITPHRIFTLGTGSLEDAKTIRAAFGCTINDVFLASVAGGLRRYLQGRGELPEVPLVGSIPVSTREASDHHTWGNRLNKIYTDVRTDVEDPVERLKASHDAAEAAKRDLELTRGARLENWIEVMPPWMLKAIGRAFNRIKLAGGPSSENLIVSNVPGPRQPLWAGPAKVDAFYSIGPITVGVCLNVTVWSYVDQLNFCFVACREAMPDLWDLTHATRESFDELLKAAADAGGQEARP